jgi:ribonuclease J
VVEIEGLPTMAGRQPMEQLVLEAVDEAFRSLPKARRRDPDAIREAVERSVRGRVNAVWDKKPRCHVLVVQL